MLIRFKVGNFLSFNKIQELSMISGETRSHLDHIHKFDDMGVLKISALYGANASGKSNLIKALRESRQMIVMDMPLRANKYFRPSAANKDKPSYFEFEFENNGKYYSYGFEFLLSKQKIESEWLYGLESEGDNKIFFQRIGNKIEHTFEGDDKIRMDVYAKDMKEFDRTLFLREMYRKTRTDEKGLLVFSDVFKWFSQKMKLFGADIYDNMDRIEKEKERDVVELLKAFDTGITGIHYERIEMPIDVVPAFYMNKIYEDLIREKKKNPNAEIMISSFKRGEVFSLSGENEVVLNKLVFKHKNSEASFDMEEESEGTQRLYDLLKMIVSKDEDNIYILDELDIKLHPQLTFGFINLFLNQKVGTKNQLIFTTHESNLMDFKLLRRDEIWFVQKEEDGSSSLYSLEDFNERTDRKIDKTYLEGRYGGVPVFSTIFPISAGDTNEAPKK